MSNSIDTKADPRNLAGCIDTLGLYLTWTEAPWDSKIFGYPVLHISNIEVRGPGAVDVIHRFEIARDACGSKLVSCRMSHERLCESMLLESIGFRFIEMLYHPELDGLQTCEAFSGHGLTVARAVLADMPAVNAIAGIAFRNERFHVDPRLPTRLGDQRYQNWARSAIDHPTQHLYVLRDKQVVVAFFVTENLADGTCYWHLNAVAPEEQGKGYGRRGWQAMLGQAQSGGAKRVQTSIVARNHRVLNLYARLGFYFPPPLMTFHWVSPI